MKTKLLLTLFFTFIFYLLSSQVPQGFNYQAIARNSQGKEIVNTALQVKISILTDTAGFYVNGTGTYVWEELQNVTTNSFGLFTILFGSTTATKTLGSAASFSAIDWKTSPLYIGTKIYYLGAWKNLGTTRLGSVPYSMVAGAVSSLTKLNVKGTATSPDSALFEVKNLNGQTVFAVYNEGIRAYVDNGIMKGATKGGFAIGGFGTAKAPSQNLMMISPDSARIYVNEATAKNSTKGGFAIGGFNATKGSSNKFMLLTPLNYFIGHNSGKYDTVGTYNSTLGYETAKSLVTGSNDVFIGYQSGLSDFSGSSNVFIGSQSGYSTVNGGYNVFIGTQAGYLNTSGQYNIVLGRQAGYSTTGSSNIFLGDLTAYYNTTGKQNVMAGDWAGFHNNTGSWNIFLGAESGWYNTTGTNNIFVGFESGYQNTIGYDNIAIGNKADSSIVDGTYNVMIGTKAGRLNTSGDYNSAIGFKAGENTTSSWNSMLGYLAGNSTTSGGSQVLIGYQAGQLNTNGWNTMLGSLAGRASGNGYENTFIGLAAGEFATGSDNVFLGRWAGRYEYTNSNKLIIETNYTGTDNYNNALIYGDFSSKYLRVNGALTTTSLVTSDDSPAIIGQHNVTPWYGYGVKGFGGYMGVRGEASLAGTGNRYGVYGVASGGTSVNVGVYGSASGASSYAGYFNGTVYGVSFTTTSDRNLKKNILPLSGTLQKVLELQGVTYDWKSESELASSNLINGDAKGDKKGENEPQRFNFPKGTQIGVIAQDVEKIVPELVQTDANGLKSVDYIKIIPLLIEGIKDQQKIIESQAKRIDDLEKAVNLLLNQKK
jgi:hypothetical protein